MDQFIRITNATENNLKNVSVDIPKNHFVVITGPSGSGKSTLALDILQRESQRQYMEANGIISSLVNKPKVGSVVGLSPSIGVGQQVTNRNPRSTVGTVTDMYTYMRVLYEKLGERQCPSCGTIVKQALISDELSATITCGNCGHDLENLTRAHFSFNTLEGACPVCSGLGKTVDIHVDQVFNQELSLKDGAITFWFAAVREYHGRTLEAGAEHYGFKFDVNLPLKNYSDVQRDFLYYGAESEEFKRHFPDIQPPKTVIKGKFEGVLTGMWRRYKETGGSATEGKFFYSNTCPGCGGEKLKKESRLAKVGGYPITEVSKWPLEEVLNWVRKLEHQQGSLTGMVLEDLTSKITRIVNVGLSYLSLDREAITLSGGELQRLRLATILGSGLTGVLYILDEPTAGLHPKDTLGLVKIIKQLRDIGNTVLVIEHDVSVMEQADHIIDLGPGAGALGGEIVGEGTLLELQEQPLSVTGAFVKEAYAPPKKRRSGTGDHITVYNAHKNNLKHITVSFPLGCFVTVTGVSGSGKSSLLFDIVAAQESNREGYDQITGFEAIDKMVTVDQSALSRMQRSNVATYTEVFTLLRNLFSKLPAAVGNGLSAKHFSFNTEGGRCENCQGLGYVLTKMYFLPDFEVECPMCNGKRFKEKVLAVTYREHSISDILDLSIEESMPLFESQKKITAIIQLLCEVGLGYLKWGQTLTTLSGGEGQRLKLARELSKSAKGHVLYILDEPSTGLHPNDVKTLLLLINKLVDSGNTVIVVEHNTDIIRASDWVIDLGPEGGVMGGYLVAEGTPEQIAASKDSYTGAYLDF